MGDAHRTLPADANCDRSASSDGDNVYPKKVPSLRRRSGIAANMSDLRVVNTSPGTEWRQRQDADFSLSSPRPGSRAKDFATSGDEMEEELMSRIASPAPPSVFDDIAEEPDERYTDNTALGSGDGYALASGSDDEDAFNLKPPPAKREAARIPEQPNLEYLSDRFFSSPHLDLILRDHGLALRFKRFLQTYRKQHVEVLQRYAEAKKAVAALEYANSVANDLKPPSGYPPFVAANIDQRFEEHTKTMLEELTDEALPAYLTYRLVGLVTDR